MKIDRDNALGSGAVTLINILQKASVIRYKTDKFKCKECKKFMKKVCLFWDEFDEEDIYDETCKATDIVCKSFKPYKKALKPTPISVEEAIEKAVTELKLSKKWVVKSSLIASVILKDPKNWIKEIEAL